MEITRPDICTVSDGRVELAINVLAAGNDSKEGVAAARRRVESGAGAEEGVFAACDVTIASARAEERVEDAESVIFPRIDAREQVIRTLYAQHAIPTDVVLRRGIDVAGHVELGSGRGRADADVAAKRIEKYREYRGVSGSKCLLVKTGMSIVPADPHAGDSIGISDHKPVSGA